MKKKSIVIAWALSILFLHTGIVSADIYRSHGPLEADYREIDRLSNRIQQNKQTLQSLYRRMYSASQDEKNEIRNQIQYFEQENIKNQEELNKLLG